MTNLRCNDILCRDYEDEAERKLGLLRVEVENLKQQKGELQELLFAMVDECGAELHEDDCPEDDTCSCAMAARVNKALAGMKGPLPTGWCTCVPEKNGTHQPDCVG